MVESTRHPRDLKAPAETEPGELSEENREFLVHAVAGTGGRLGPHPGVVELAVALVPGDADVDAPVRRFGIPEQFLAHAGRGEVPVGIGLTPVRSTGRTSASPPAGGEPPKQPQDRQESPQ
ncbi:1-deoxy-D-xylulose-5-phosphate synthase N-terminal domain-containing protein [Streptomyces sp. GDS52]|uniref:1-deoxy-D-xylulose-5-phosphate synthase N-terminal domain-containing protein n=1 Tax=Streptomyces TaxID=1883 RepID=UPI003C6F53AC